MNYLHSIEYYEMHPEFQLIRAEKSEFWSKRFKEEQNFQKIFIY